MFNYFGKCIIGFVLLFSPNPKMLRFGYFLIGQNRLRGYLRKFFPLARTVRAFFVIVLTEDFLNLRLFENGGINCCCVQSPAFIIY